MSVDNVVTNTKTGIDGNSYTSSISNDKLTNNDFLRLMLEEMKMQDPTKPMDSAALMDSQLKMSTIESNQDMANAMTLMQKSYSNSALSTASNMIGRIVEDGSESADGLLKSYKVETVENKEGELFVNVRQLTGMVDGLKNVETEELILYDDSGNIYEDGVATDYHVSINADGRFEFNDDGSLKLLDVDNEVVTETAIKDRYIHAGSAPKYSAETTVIALSNIQQVR
jgi:flagellar basal-body rod modification protein FlgD